MKEKRTVYKYQVDDLVMLKNGERWLILGYHTHLGDVGYPFYVAMNKNAVIKSVWEGFIEEKIGHFDLRHVFEALK